MQKKHTPPEGGNNHSTKRIEVDLSRQILTAYEGKKLVYRFLCATGRLAYRTPTGRFTIYRKDEKHVSHQYHARMDYAMFFHGGVAIHEANHVEQDSHLKVLGHNVGSHGCVHLSGDDARRLFRWAPMHTPVEVK